MEIVTVEWHHPSASCLAVCPLLASLRMAFSKKAVSWEVNRLHWSPAGQYQSLFLQASWWSARNASNSSFSVLGRSGSPTTPLLVFWSRNSLHWNICRGSVTHGWLHQHSISCSPSDGALLYRSNESTRVGDIQYCKTILIWLEQCIWSPVVSSTDES